MQHQTITREIAVPAKELFIRVDRKLYQVASFEQASAMYSAARDAHGEGTSRTPDGEIVDCSGKQIARISYNGKVWPAQEWTPGMAPIFNPYSATTTF